MTTSEIIIPDHLTLVSKEEEGTMLRKANLLRTIITDSNCENKLAVSYHDSIIFKGEDLYNNFINATQIEKGKHFVNIPEGKESFTITCTAEMMNLNPGRQPFTITIREKIDLVSVVDMVCKYYKTCSQHRYIEMFFVDEVGQVGIVTGS